MSGTVAALATVGRRWLVAAVVVALVMVAGCDWTQVGFGPGKTNVNPYTSQP